MKNRTRYIISYLVIFLSFAIILGANWYSNYFGNVSLSEILFHLKFPLDGANYDFVFMLISDCIWQVLFLTFIVFIIFCPLYNNKIIIKLKFFKKKISFDLKYYLDKIFKYVPISLFIISIGVLFYRFSVISYIATSLSTTKIYEDYYVRPESANIEFPSKKRNLIYILLESMESSYADIENGGVKKVNYIPNLTKLASENINFSQTDKLGGAIQVSNVGWTIAGMIAQTSGIPTTIPVDGNAFTDMSKAEFLPGAYSIGEILRSNGYSQYLMLGSDAVFGGRKNYFQKHGNYEIFDYYKAIGEGYIDKDYRVWWGFEDRKLFDIAKEKLTTIASYGTPFNLTMLTVDTHFFDGYLDNNCPIKYDKQFDNVLSCSDALIYDFIKWIQEQDFYENTTIVISGDHLYMDSNYFTEDDKTNGRYVYNVFINSAVNTTNNKNRTFSTIDMFPTTLASLGVKIEGDRLGLGTNLFSSKQTLMEELGANKFSKELGKTSKFYNKNILEKK